MDDLNGLDWTASSNSRTKPASTGTGNYYPTLRPTPPPISSGRTTPLSAQGSGFPKPTLLAPKSSTPDSFSNLVSFGSAKQSNNLSLQEQHLRLQAEKAKKEEEQRKKYNAQFGNSQFWDVLGAGSVQAQPSSSKPPAFPDPTSGRSSPFVPAPAAVSNSNDDLFAAFNKDTKVDSSSHYPPPSLPTSGKSTPAPVSGNRLDLNDPKAWNKQSEAANNLDLGDDDDPFGLGQLASRGSAPVQNQQLDNDDDFLGDLGRPVEEVRAQQKPRAEPRAASPVVAREESDDPWDKAVDELVDMGFSAENSRRALTESGAGLDVQAAVGWLLNDAHRQAKEKSQSRTGSAQVSKRNTGDNVEPSADRSRNDAIPAWMRQEGRDRSQSRREESRSPANSDGDITRTAAAVGSTLLKSANSLWKTSQKKVQKAVSEFQQEADSSQPKWMRQVANEAQEIPGRTNMREESSSQQPSVTKEAMLLEADSRPQPRRPKPSADTRFQSSPPNSSKGDSPIVSAPSSGRSTPVPRWQQSGASSIQDAKSRLSKQALEEQSAQAYISPSRRKKATPVPAPIDESDLLFGNSNGSSGIERAQPTATTAPPASRVEAAKTIRPVQQSPPITIRPKAPTRNIPNLSPAALNSSTQHRLTGTAHFKRGDYAAAHASYSSSLAALPQNHPITIILFCNRSLTALKTGEPKTAVTDAESALNLIGPSRGHGETIDLQGEGAGEGKKDMKEFWGKALTRKAEALEQMERWSDAGAIWKQAVEAGVGGATAAQGRQRCEKAMLPKSKPAPKPVQKAPPRPKPSASLAPVQDSEAVKRMKAANAAADKADDEKFALSDSVDARLRTWRDGRKDNLRALIGGLDQILWEGSGWKKVGMHELVMNSKVKINYMKAIAKVHPDKLPQDASVEVQMISAAVFATLNEAWDKFKTDNGM